MKPTRRKLVSSALAAGTLASPAAAQSGQRVKQVHYRGARPAKTPLYSEAISYGDLVFISGHGVNNVAGVRTQTKSVLDEIEKALQAAGSSMDKVLKCNVYLKTLDDYKAMNETYLGRFGDRPPVRTTVAVAGIPLDGCLVEIDVIAHRS
jgi:2-iminobutanoate/2-iminopropanoate deaminase